MSTQQDIRLLASKPKLRAQLDARLEPDPITGKVTPFKDGTFATSSSAAAAGGTTSGCNTNSNDTTQQEDTKKTDPTDPNSFYKGGGGTGSDSTTQTGTQDVESVIDGEAGPQSAPDSAYSNTGVLSGVTGMTDCNTGKGINFHLDGQFKAPDGWADAETPGDITGDWTADTYWADGCGFLGIAPIEAYTPQMVYDQLNAAIQADSRITEFSIYSGLNKVGDVNYYYSWSAFESGIGTGVIEQNIQRSNCSSSTPSDPTVCVSTIPKQTAWPTDGSYDLALQDGQFITSPYDSEAPLSTLDGQSKVSFCFGDGRTGEIAVTSNGGAMVYETSSGAPTGTVRVYASDGTLQAAGDATTTFMNQYLPK